MLTILVLLTIIVAFVTMIACVFLLYTLVHGTSRLKEGFQTARVGLQIPNSFADDEEEEDEEDKSAGKQGKKVTKYAEPKMKMSLHVIVSSYAGKRALPDLARDSIQNMICPLPKSNRDREYRRMYRNSVVGCLERKTYGYVKFAYEDVKITIDDNGKFDFYNYFKIFGPNPKCVKLSFDMYKIMVKPNLDLSINTHILLLVPALCEYVYGVAYAPSEVRGISIVATPNNVIPLHAVVHEFFHTFSYVHRVQHSNYLGQLYQDITCVMGYVGGEGYLNVAHGNYVGIMTPVPKGNIYLSDLIDGHGEYVDTFVLPRTWTTYQNHIAIHESKEPKETDQGFKYFISYVGYGYTNKKRKELQQQIQTSTPGYGEVPRKTMGICVHTKQWLTQQDSSLLAFIPLGIINDNRFSAVNKNCVPIITSLGTWYLYLTINAFSKREATVTIHIKNNECDTPSPSLQPFQ